MRLRAALRFSEVACRFDTVELKRFCTAPRSARMLETWLSAPSRTARAELAPATVEMLTVSRRVRAGEADATPPYERTEHTSVKLEAELSVSGPRVGTPVPPPAPVPAVAMTPPDVPAEVVE